jgi:peroxin-6
MVRLRDLFKSSLPSGTQLRSLQMSILIKGARGAGKKSLVRAVADEVGFNVVMVSHLSHINAAIDTQVDCYDIVGETTAVIEGSLQASLEKAKSAAPSILLLDHIEALVKRSESSATGKSPPIIKTIDDLLEDMRASALEIGWPIVLMGTTVDEDSVPGGLLSCFKQDLSISVRVIPYLQ